MSSMTIPYSEQQLMAIASDIERLYASQDKRLDQKRQAFLVSQIADSGYPYASAIEGIRSMFNHDIRNLKLSTIMAAIKEKVYIIAKDDGCMFCHQGWIHMDRESGHHYAVPCLCPLGTKIAAYHKTMRWNGQREQIRFGKKYFLRDRKAESRLESAERKTLDRDDVDDKELQDVMDMMGATEAKVIKK